MKRKVELAIVAVAIATSVLGVVSTASAAWSGGCSTGYGCMWHGDYAASEALKTNTTDSNFSGDFFVSGIPLDNQVKVVHNNVGAGDGIKAHTLAGYGGSHSICIPYGFLVGPYPLGSGGGVSSLSLC